MPSGVRRGERVRLLAGEDLPACPRPAAGRRSRRTRRRSASGRSVGGPAALADRAGDVGRPVDHVAGGEDVRRPRSGSVAGSATSRPFGSDRDPVAEGARCRALMPIAAMIDVARRASTLGCPGSAPAERRPDASGAPEAHLAGSGGRLTAPCASPSTSAGATRRRNATPSFSASAASTWWAGISSRRRGGRRRSRDAAPRRRAVRAASIATLPPPTTTTRLPARSTGWPSLTWRRKSVPPRTPRRSSPGTPRLVERCVPVATRTASKPSSLSAAGSRDRVAGRDLDAEVRDVLDVALDDRLGQPVGRDRRGAGSRRRPGAASKILTA